MANNDPVGYNREVENLDGRLSGGSSVYSIFYLLPPSSPPVALRPDFSSGGHYYALSEAVTFDFVFPAMSLRRLYSRQATYTYRTVPPVFFPCLLSMHAIT